MNTLRRTVTLLLVLVLTLGIVLASSAQTLAASAKPGPAAPFPGVSGTLSGAKTGTVKLKGAGDIVSLTAVLTAGAEYVRKSQADVTEDNAGNGDPDIDPEDAGWDWDLTAPAFSHSSDASPVNLYGETALGLYYAYLRSADAKWMTAMQDVATKALATANINKASDIIFLCKFESLVGGGTYKAAAKSKYDARIAAAGSATYSAQTIRDTRGITQGYPNGIIAWDIGAYVVGADMLAGLYPSDPLDYAQQAMDMAEVLYQDSFNDNPGLFDVVDDAGWDPTYANKNF